MHNFSKSKLLRHALALKDPPRSHLTRNSIPIPLRIQRKQDPTNHPSKRKHDLAGVGQDSRESAGNVWHVKLGGEDGPCRR
jgi:hypothetical protein